MGGAFYIGGNIMGLMPEHHGQISHLRQTAILVDGGFYRVQAKKLFGEKSAQDRADELVEYCKRHIREQRSNLYRIFYYDCPPSDKVFFHPLTRQQVNLGKS